MGRRPQRAAAVLRTGAPGSMVRPAEARDHRKIAGVSHPLVLALFSDPSMAADAAGALHALGVSRESLSVVAHTHADAQALADRMDATPGVDLEDSRAAARLGEVGGRVLATV